MIYTLNQSLQTPSGAVSVAISASGEAEINADVVIPIGTDTAVALAFPYANIKAVILLADVAVTLETNSSSAATQTFSLLANVPKLWITGGDGSNPFTANVTTCFATAVAAGTLKVRVLYDPTP